MLIVPVQAVPAQVVQVPLGGQNCTLNLYQLDTGLFMDVLVDQEPVVTGALCLNLNLVVRSEHLGFVGDLMWIDNMANPPSDGDDPYYTGLGTQFSLAYLAPTDLPPNLGPGVS